MKTIEVKLYRFDELSAEAKETAITKCRQNENYLDYEWYDCIYDDWKETLKMQGIDISRIYFTGFCCQGDGACFEAEFDLIKFIRSRGLGCKYQLLLEALELDSEAYCRVKHSGHYYHENCTDFDYEILLYDLVPEWLKGAAENQFYDDFIPQLKEVSKDYMRRIYKDLDAAYDELNSDESITEYLINNSYEEEYREDGERSDYE